MGALRQSEIEPEVEFEESPQVEKRQAGSSRVKSKIKPHIVKSEFRAALDKPMRSKFRTAFLIFTALAMAVTIRSGISASRGYTLVNTQQQAQTIERENARLRIEIAHLKSPQRIRDIAVRELGMEEPTKVYFGHER